MLNQLREVNAFWSCGFWRRLSVCFFFASLRLAILFPLLSVGVEYAVSNGCGSLLTKLPVVVADERRSQFFLCWIGNASPQSFEVFPDLISFFGSSFFQSPSRRIR